MTLHVFYNHECPNCRAQYIPYEKGVPCPKCGKVEKVKPFDFVAKVAESLRFNLANYDSFVPPMFAVNTFGDALLYNIFGIFEAYRVAPKSGKKGKPSFEEFARNGLGKADLGRDSYLRTHLIDIVIKASKKIDFKKRKPNDSSIRSDE